jgi:hypothetical protein
VSVVEVAMNSVVLGPGEAGAFVLLALGRCLLGALAPHLSFEPPPGGAGRGERACLGPKLGQK